MVFFAELDYHRYLIGTIFLIAGILHIIAPKPYIKIMPTYIPKPKVMVFLSGIAEILGGIAILIPHLQRFAGWGLIILLFAVFPANWDMFWKAFQKKKHPILTLLLFLRLPIQFWLIYWVFKAAELRFS